MNTVVHCHIFNPSKTIFKQVKRDPAECTTVTCSLENCSLRDRKQCMFISLFGWNKCPYGNYYKEKGPTTKAAKFSKWIADKTEMYKGVPCLETAECKLAFIGDYVYIPYPHANFYKGMGGEWGEKDSDIPFLEHSQAFSKGNCLLPREHWTIDTVLKLIDFRPRALFGTEIDDYQKKSVPLFLEHLREVDPLMYQAVITVRPELNKAPNYIGRKAYVKTLKPDIIIPAYDARYPVVWKWDGEFLITESANAYDSTWGNVAAESLVLKLKPREDATVKVADNAWVTETTKFKD